MLDKPESRAAIWTQLMKIKAIHQNAPGNVVQFDLPQVPRVDEMIEIDGEQCRVTRVCYVVENGACVDVHLELI